MSLRLSDRTANVIGWLAGLNFVAAFLGWDYMLGGSASAGKIEGGRYYLGSHGSFVETSQTLYVLSYCHGISGYLGIGLILWLCQRHYEREKRRKQQERHERLERHATWPSDNDRTIP